MVLSIFIQRSMGARNSGSINTQRTISRISPNSRLWCVVYLAPAPGMPPPGAVRPLDWMHGEGGRLIYDCEPYDLLGGGLCK